MKKANLILKDELEAFNTRFRDVLRSRIPLLDRILRYIIKQKGKQMRPMFVFLCAKLGGEVNEATYRAASLVELLHTATLIHDDVVDEAAERRGFFSINALWKNKVAVLAGDYLLSKGLLLSLDNDDFHILKILSTAVRKMSEGELVQIEKSRKLNLDESIYYEIIRGKTASLLASACSAGASTTFHNEEDTKRLHDFGEKLGMAFQIKDDLLDYGSDDIGKPTGNDIKEKKLTLPLIYTLNKAEPALRRRMIYLIKNKNRDKKAIRFVLDAVHKSGGIEYAQQKMLLFRNEALDLLFQYPKNEVRDALEELLHYTTDRSF